MKELILPSVLTIISMLLLLWSADVFVKGAAKIAERLKISKLLIGIVIIGFATSLPELMVSATSAFEGNPNIALGNAYGSNLFNIGVVLGVSAIIYPIVVKKNLLTQELPILIAITLLSIALLWDLTISRLDSIILLIGFVLIMTFTISCHLKQSSTLYVEEHNTFTDSDLNLWQCIAYILIGLCLLLFSSQLLVDNSVKIARYFGISDLIIGLTIVAVGTSLPELASAVAAARKGENSLVVGNIIGSNIFNTLAVIGIAGVVHQPFQIKAEILSRDLLSILILIVLLYLFSYRSIKYQNPGVISRLAGILLLSMVTLYNACLLYKVSALNSPTTQQQHYKS